MASSVLLLATVLVLTACGPKAEEPDDPVGTSSPSGWQVSKSGDGLLEVAHPSDWRPAGEAADGISLEVEDGCSLRLDLVPDGKPEGLSQAQILETMESAAIAGNSDDRRNLEFVGRRVWLGQSFIWHEVHYVVSWKQSCDDCRPEYVISLLAFPSQAESLRARFSCPGSDPPSEDIEQLLLDVVNTASVVSTGTT